MLNNTSNENTPISEYFYFCSPIYKKNIPQYLEIAKTVSEENLVNVKKESPKGSITFMSTNFFNDDRLNDFSMEILNTAWGLLDSQGFDMSNYKTNFHEMWCQEHYKNSAMESHVHGLGSQLIAFYFLETPKNCSRPVFHDPRPGKVQINLPEKDPSNATLASNAINFIPEPGDLIISNAYVQHSFSRHENAKLPIKFIHMNIGVFYSPNENNCFTPSAEVI